MAGIGKEGARAILMQRSQQKWSKRHRAERIHSPQAGDLEQDWVAKGASRRPGAAWQETDRRDIRETPLRYPMA